MKPNAQEETRLARKAQEAVADALRSLLLPKEPPKVKALSSHARAKRCAALRLRVKDQLATAKTAERRASLLNTLKRIERIEAKAKQQALSAHVHNGECVLLEERKYKPIRRLTLQETRVDFEALNSRFNDLEASLEDELATATAEELERALGSAKKRLDAMDIAAIATIAFLFRQRVSSIINRSVKSSYDIGKEAAAKEIGVDRPSTPLQDRQLMNVDAADIAEGFASNLESALGSALKAGLVADASVAAIVAAGRQAVINEAAKEITNITGTIVGQYVNMGRNNVIFSNIEKVVSMQRSEVLDGRTCALCISLDERVVSPTDPMAYLQIVHTHCRGVWVPVLAADDEQPEVTGIPKSIVDTFETIDGRPVTNAFKQLKKPINDVSRPAMEEIKKRFESKEK